VHAHLDWTDTNQAAAPQIKSKTSLWKAARRKITTAKKVTFSYTTPEKMEPTRRDCHLIVILLPFFG